jgi:hypothetical protein
MSNPYEMWLAQLVTRDRDLFTYFNSFSYQTSCNTTPTLINGDKWWLSPFPAFSALINGGFPLFRVLCGYCSFREIYMTRDQRQHTSDPAVSAGHIADRVTNEVWGKTHNFGEALLAGSEAYTSVIKENILDEFPPCPNEECESFGSSAQVADSHVGFRYYCYGCCQTFS